MPVGNISGLSSGIQWDETIDLLMQIERQPVDLLEIRKSEYQSQLTNWSSIESKLNSLNTKAENLDSVDEFLAKSATSSDSDVVTLTAGSSAAPSSHDIIVNQLATSHVHVHQNGWADLNSTAVNNSGSDQSFSYDYGGTLTTVTIPDGSTLQDVANLINRDDDNPGVIASVINDGTGGGSDYHLVLSGEDTGEDYSIQVIDTVGNPTDLGDGSQFDEAAWDATQDAQNAEIRVDGFPDPAWGWPNPWIESDSNDIEDVIPGVTMHLHDTSGGSAIHVEISLDKAAIRSNINTIVNAYNEVMDTIGDLTYWDEENESAGPLMGDSLVRTIQTDLMMMIAENIPGTDESDEYRTLGQIGVSLTSGGRLKVDGDELDDALDDDPEAVARLFVFDSETSSNFVSVTGQTYKTIGDTYDWTMTYNADGELVKSGTNTIDGQAARVHGDILLEGAEGSDVEDLMLILSNPGDGPSSLSGTVKVYTGLSVLLNRMIEELSDPFDGSLKNNRDRINNNIDNLDEKIEAWEDRLELIEENYQRKYTQMEILIGQLQTQSSYLSSM